MPQAPRTLFDKVWDAHTVLTREGGDALLWIDRHFVHEGSHHAFGALRGRGSRVARPELTFGVADHYVPTRGRGSPIPDPAVRAMVARLDAHTREQDITLFGLGDPRQGIVHVVGPEQGLTLPGLTLVCGDSHTSTHGAYGAIVFGIGASEVAHVLMTQTLWQRRPKRMQIRVDGRLGPGIGAKDLALGVIARLGGDVLLHDQRFDAAGAPRPEHPMDAPERRGTSILVARRNFGSGSSREAAVYALVDGGVQESRADESRSLAPMSLRMAGPKQAF